MQHCLRTVALALCLASVLVDVQLMAEVPSAVLEDQSRAILDHEVVAVAFRTSQFEPIDIICGTITKREVAAITVASGQSVATIPRNQVARIFVFPDRTVDYTVEACEKELNIAETFVAQDTAAKEKLTSLFQCWQAELQNLKDGYQKFRGVWVLCKTADSIRSLESAMADTPSSRGLSTELNTSTAYSLLAERISKIDANGSTKLEEFKLSYINAYRARADLWKIKSIISRKDYVSLKINAVQFQKQASVFPEIKPLLAKAATDAEAAFRSTLPTLSRAAANNLAADWGISATSVTSAFHLVEANAFALVEQATAIGDLDTSLSLLKSEWMTVGQRDALKAVIETKQEESRTLLKGFTGSATNSLADAKSALQTCQKARLVWKQNPDIPPREAPLQQHLYEYDLMIAAAQNLERSGSTGKAIAAYEQCQSRYKDSISAEAITKLRKNSLGL